MSPREVTSADRKIGLLVRTRRNAENMSQEALGQALGVSFQQIQKYEKGLNRISAVRLQQIAKALNEDVAYFLNVGEVSPQMEKFGKSAASPHGVRLLKAFTEINDSSKELLLIHMAEHLAELSSWQEESK